MYILFYSYFEKTTNFQPITHIGFYRLFTDYLNYFSLIRISVKSLSWQKHVGTLQFNLEVGDFMKNFWPFRINELYLELAKVVNFHLQQSFEKNDKRKKVTKKFDIVFDRLEFPLQFKIEILRWVCLCQISDCHHFWTKMIQN